MSTLSKLAISTALLTSISSPSFAFFNELVIGMTSVTNNLIDSTESVTNNTVNTASTTMLSLSSNPGKMADRIGTMADRIGYMADRIVTTEGIMAGLAHKIIDSNQQPRVIHQYASAYAPAPVASGPAGYSAGSSFNNSYANPYTNTSAYNPGYSRPVSIQKVSSNPYLAASQAQVTVVPAPNNGYVKPDNSHYSASHMIYGVSGATYSAAKPTYGASTYQANSPSGYGLATQPATRTAQNSCGFSYGVARTC